MATRNLKLALGVGALVFAGVLAATLAMRSQPGFMTGLHPIDGGRAVFTMRHNPDSGESRAWIGVVGPEGLVWSRELPALTYSIYARHGLTVDDGLVTVKVSDTQTYAQVLAFDVSTGEPRWSSDRLAFAPSEYDTMLHIVMGAAPFAGDGLVLHPEHDRQEASLVMRSAEDGTVTWRHPLAKDGLYGMARTEDHVAYRTDVGWVVLRRSDGSEVVRLEAYGAACLQDDRLSVWSDDTLRIVDLSQPEPEASEHPLEMLGFSQSCGTHDGKLVFTVGGDAGEGQRRFEVVGVDPAKAEVAWRIDLGPWEPSTIARDRDNAGPDADPLRGSISDFVPVLLDQHGIDDVKLAVLDLRSHAIAWESSPRPELLHYQVLRGSGDQHFIDGFDNLGAIDGATGKLNAAVQLHHENVRGFYAVDGRIWVYSMTYATESTLPWLVLDGASLTPTASSTEDYAPTDNTSGFRDWLG